MRWVVRGRSSPHLHAFAFAPISNLRYISHLQDEVAKARRQVDCHSALIEVSFGRRDHDLKFIASVAHRHSLIFGSAQVAFVQDHNNSVETTFQILDGYLPGSVMFFQCVEEARQWLTQEQ